MRIESFEITRGGGVLRSSAKNASSRWTHREGILLTVRDEAGHVGQGEASPLPGYCSDHLSCCQTSLQSLGPSSLQLDESEPISAQLAAGSTTLPEACPAARFALETALLDLLGRRLRRPAWNLLAAPGSDPPSPVPLTTLIDSEDPEASVRQARDASRRGITSFKVKIGRPGAFPEELALLRALREVIGEAAGLRLDANRSLPAAEVARCLELLSPLRPEFLEEPTSDFAGLLSSPLPLALDESLMAPTAEQDLPSWVNSVPIVAVVLKPAALGGLTRCLRLAERARALGVSVVVSHLLDGPVALAACAALALAVSTPGIACGLDRHVGLSAWPATSLPAFSSSHLLPSAEPGLGLLPLPLEAG